ncbi:MAG: ribosomal RNA small subunit methyltransferase A [Candidatus Omnitrophota bacterium]|nr:MAG: ribosomal RNA small subunit methyltransferase A [Candidatus Omnitrophota bacterium]
MRFKPKKKLGQNFLVDKNIQRKIIDSCGLNASDIVLEIGSGRGEITGLLAEKVKKVYAFELDSSLLSIIKENLKHKKNISVLNEDILKFNLKKFFKHFYEKIKVVGNIPYYISSPVLEYIIKNRNKIDSAFITVQKEFAQRIIAHPGSKDYGSLSCFVQCYAYPEILFLIKKSCFYPAPSVNSCFLGLKLRGHPAVDLKNENRFFKIIRKAFCQRRKILKNSLKGVVSIKKLDEFFRKQRIDPMARPEELSLQDFAELSNL